MIGGATRGAGGRALGRHLANSRQQMVRLGASRGLVAASIAEQVAELGDVVAHARTRQPLYHCHADPPPGVAWTEAQWSRYWTRFEGEFGLGNQPFAEAIHIKNGREHRHRVYSRIRADGTAIRLDHDHARREKIHRVTEHDEGMPFVGGKHNRAVATALEREGRHDVAEAMRAAGMLNAPRPVAPTTPQERAQQDRTAVPVADVRAAAWAAYQSADPEAALACQGLRLAAGDEGAVIVDATGAAHSWARCVGAGAKAAGTKGPGARAAKSAVAALPLPRLEQARRAIRDRAGAAPDIVPPPPPPPQQESAHDHITAPAAVVGRDRADNRGDQDRHDRDHPAADSGRGRRGRGPDRPDPPGTRGDPADRDRDPGRHRPPRFSRQGDAAALTAAASRPGDSVLAAALTAATTHGTPRDGRRDAPPSRAGRRRAEAAALAGGPPRPGDAGLAAAMAAAEVREAALAVIRRAVAEGDARARRRAAALAAETAATAHLRDAEDVRRRAAQALDAHDAQRPRGLWAAITGRSRRWREERDHLDAVFDAAVRAERTAERDTTVSRQAVAAVGRDGRRDAERRDVLRRTEAAVRAGRRDVVEAARRGDIETAIRLSRPPPRPAPSRPGRDEREPAPTVAATVPAPRPPWTK
ncbi:relaxase/mobilization nuclease domain-containing protein [Azospirillum sp. B506]|uniref:relaxase/mobilization nuclease domain-containing protein n=1 Tax=Azospirillum sp. B506 TaxID=137721 RepID=UPI00034ADF81|nr:hypothetical protein [Azospirillum sp. B506]